MRNTLNIRTISNSIGTQISIFVLITITVITYFRGDIVNFYKEVQAANLKELEYIKKEIELKKQSEKERFFEGLLIDYLNNSSHIDLSNRFPCDKKYMDEYRKADSSIAALEGAAKSAGLYDKYFVFFNNRKSISISTYMNCKKET